MAEFGSNVFSEEEENKTVSFLILKLEPHRAQVAEFGSNVFFRRREMHYAVSVGLYTALLFDLFTLFRADKTQ